VEEAESIEPQVMGMGQQQLEKEHTDLLTVMTSTASAYRDQERLKEAGRPKIHATEWA
jgi:hypothetical protein